MFASRCSALSPAAALTVRRRGVNYQVFPLRREARVRQASALVAVRRAERGMAESGEARAWPELARSIVEADFASADALTIERQQSRRLVRDAAFSPRSRRDRERSRISAQAIVQAAAVWFDADARIFEREITGDFCCTRRCPGRRSKAPPRRLSSHWIGDSPSPFA